MKRLFTILFALAMTMTISAQESNNKIMLPSWINELKLSGYGIVQYQASTQKDAKSNTFQLRIGRLALDGRIANDFYWKAQIQFNGNTSTLGTSPRLVDLFAEWQRYDFFKVKAGQFKRPFTFENPMHPIDQGFMGYSQNVNALAGFSDRAGAHASNGRDIGLQIQGDLLRYDARYLVHYQMGVFNGQGINTSDVDQQKDLIGGLWVMPIEGLRIGAFGWIGSYARKGSWVENEGTPDEVTYNNKVRRLQQRRYAFSAEYKANDWTIRSEYIHSTGKAFAKTGVTKDNDASLNEAIGDKADGVYALAIAPVIKKKLYAKARYDMYRPNAEWNMCKTQYEVGANWLIHKNLQINAEYAFVNNRALNKHNYNIFDVELAFRF
ncbi:MAG: OprO/OprP family phosphate-selective porin [Prevotella sp.]|nr:OprO/OprP family phosphate-selective porin [Prevotella sp.]